MSELVARLDSGLASEDAGRDPGGARESCRVFPSHRSRSAELGPLVVYRAGEETVDAHPLFRRSHSWFLVNWLNAVR